MRKNNYFNTKKVLLLLFIAAIGFSGCKKYLDINQNPNNPDNADPNLLLPTVEAAMGQIIGNSFQVNGGIWSQYWTQSPLSSQYRTVDQYSIPNTGFDRSWLTIYRSAFQNAELILKSNAPAYRLQKVLLIF